MKNEKSQPRLAVEAAIQRAKSPITVEEIATRTGLHADTVRAHLNNCLGNGLVNNTCPGSKPATYVWGWPETEQVGNFPEPRTCLMAGTNYTGNDLSRPPPRGESSMHAYTLPSLVSGESVERRRPILMASSASTNLNARPL